jgi:DNA-binding MarR family transcriptional regulator
MTDINDTLQKARPPRPSSREPAEGGRARLSETALLEFAELLFFAYRDFTRDPDEVLKEMSFGRAHHRVLHFVNRHSGLRVADLLELLNITKQSLGRVLKQLIDQGYIQQFPGSQDRRVRLLYPTPEGRALAERLAAPQLVRLEEALHAAGPGAETQIRRFLKVMVNAEERDKAASILRAAAPAPLAEEADGQ